MEIYRQITANNIELKPYPFLKELAMEAYLMENEDILKLDTSNFEDVTVLDAEISLKNGGSASKKNGRIDLLAKYGVDYLAIVELKVNEINNDTLVQLENYLKKRKQIIQKHPEYWTDTDINPKWIGIVVGSSISPELQKQLQEGYTFNFDNIEIPIAGMVIKRFRSSKNEIFVTTDSYFNFKYSKRDFSKFSFNGKSLNKTRLVNQVLKHYVAINPNITYAELENVFPPSIQGSTGVFTLEGQAREIFDNTGHKRHYIKPEELIRLRDTTIATCNQWGVGNINNFIDKINELDIGFNIELE